MELVKINELINKKCIKTFKVIYLTNNLNLATGDINIIFLDNKAPIINAFLSDCESENRIEEYSAIIYRLFTEDIVDISKNFILIDQETNQKYISIKTNISFSPNETSFQNLIIAVQTIESLEQEKKIKFIFANENVINFSFKAPFLLSDCLRYKDKQWKKIVLDYSNAMAMIVNPIEINKDSKFFFNTLNYFHLIDLKEIYIDNNNKIIKDKSSKVMQDFFAGVENILKNTDIMCSGYKDTSPEYFHQHIYGGNDIKGYQDYAINELFKSLTMEDIKYESLIAMCSSFLNSSFCVDNGLTEKHKWFFPFYFDFVSGDWFLRSTFYKLWVEDDVIKFSNIFDSDLKVKSKVNFPSTSKNIKEIDYTLDWKDWNASGLNYKVFLLMKNIKSPFRLLHLNKLKVFDSVVLKTETNWPKKTSIDFLQEYVKKQKQSDSIFIVTNTILSRKYSHSKVTVNGEVFEDGGAFGSWESFDFNKDYSADSSTESEEWDEMDPSSPTDPTPIHYIKTTERYHYWEIKIQISYSPNNKIYDYTFDDSVNINDVMIKNRFILDHGLWIEFIKELELNNNEFDYFNLNIKRGEIVCIKGLFLPNEIIINNKKNELMIDSQIGEININYLN